MLDKDKVSFLLFLNNTSNTAVFFNVELLYIRSIALQLAKNFLGAL